MAVYKQNYKDYAGSRTSGWLRFLILTRYSYARLFQSRFLVLFLAVCFFYPFGCAVFIYLSHNSPLLAAMQFRTAAMPPIDGSFFYIYCVVQGSLAFILTTFVGPPSLPRTWPTGLWPCISVAPFPESSMWLER